MQGAKVSQAQRLAQTQASKMIQELEQIADVEVPKRMLEVETRRRRKRKRGLDAMLEGWSFKIYPIPDWRDIERGIKSILD